MLSIYYLDSKHQKCCEVNPGVISVISWPRGWSITLTPLFWTCHLQIRINQPLPKWPHPKNSVLLFQIYTTVKHSRYLLSPWQWQSSNGLRPLPFGSTLCSSAPPCMCRCSSFSHLSAHRQGISSLQNYFSSYFVPVVHLEMPRWSSGSAPGQSKEKSRSLSKVTWNKIHSSSFNEYQNILPVGERKHFCLVWILAASFNALSNVLSKLRTWIHNCWKSGQLWTWRFSSSQSLSGSFSLIHSLCLNYSFFFTHSAENWNLLMSGSRNRWESSID